MPPRNDPENMTFVIGRDLERNEGEDNLDMKHLQQAVLHLYKVIDGLQEEVDQLRE